MKDLVIFGNSQLGEIAHYYFAHEAGRRVVAFTADREFITDSEFCGLPVIPFDELNARYSTETHDAFVAVSYRQLNKVRRQKFMQMQEAGYKLVSYIHPTAAVWNEEALGANCFVLENVTIQPFARLRDNVTVWSGTHIGHHSVIGAHTFVTSHVVVSGGVEIGESCFLGVNATLRDHIKIGDNTIIGAGALIMSDAEAGGVYSCKGTERSTLPSAKVRSL